MYIRYPANLRQYSYPNIGHQHLGSTIFANIIEFKQEIFNVVANTEEKKTDSLKEDARDEINMGSLTYVRNVKSAVNLYPELKYHEELKLVRCDLCVKESELKGLTSPDKHPNGIFC